MREMPRALGCKLGVLSPCATIEISYLGENPEGPITFGGPYFHITEKGVEGPFYPTLWAELGLAPAASPEVGVMADKPQAREGQPGAA
jgi:hypothetical protein